MLALLFSIGDDRYGLPVAAVAEVTPVLRLKQLPGAPDWVAGLCNFRGSAIPVIDLSALAGGAPCRRVLSTRMIVVDYRRPDGSVRLLGLLAERATETALIADGELAPPGVRTDETPWLGPVAVSGGEVVQLVGVDRLLAPEAAARLFAEGEGE